MKQIKKQRLNKKEFLNKAYSIAEEFCKLLWQRYDSTHSNEFIDIATSGIGTIEIANICVSFQHYGKPDVNEPLEPATISISIGTHNSHKRVSAYAFPKLDENGNIKIKGWKAQ